MWTYNYTNELYHYGVKGMKWGHRKKYYNSDGSLNKLGQARQNYKTANKDYSKAFKKSYKYSQNHPISQNFGKGKKKSDRLWSDTSYKAEVANKAQADYKQAKKDYKSEKRAAKNASTKAAVKEYDKKYNDWNKTAEQADSKWKETQEAYQKLGKNKLSRMFNAAKGTSAEAKAYNQIYEDWSATSDLAATKWSEATKAYAKTGKTYVARVINNAKYNPIKL